MGSVIMGFIIRSSDLFKIWAMTNTWLLILSFIGSIGFMIGAFSKLVHIQSI